MPRWAGPGSSCREQNRRAQTTNRPPERETLSDDLFVTFNKCAGTLSASNTISLVRRSDQNGQSRLPAPEAASPTIPAITISPAAGRANYDKGSIIIAVMVPVVPVVRKTHMPDDVDPGKSGNPEARAGYTSKTHPVHEQGTSSDGPRPECPDSGSDGPRPEPEGAERGARMHDPGRMG